MPSSEGQLHDCPSSWCVRLLRRLLTFGLCCFSWIFFRVASISDALYVIRRSITGGKVPLQYCKNAILTLYPGQILTAIVIGSLMLLFLFDWINERCDPIDLVSAWPVPVRWTAYVCFLLLLILLIPKETTSPFLYFQF